MTTSRRKPRFTATSLAALPAGDHTDPATAGLQLRVRESAAGESRTWLFRYKWRSRALRVVIGHLETMTLADARAEAIALRRGMDDGIDPRRAKNRRRRTPVASTLSSAAADGAHTIENLAHEFLERHVKPSRKKPQYVEAILKRDVLPEWAGRDARTIKPREIIELLDKIVGRGSRVMANRVAGILGQMFKFGVHRVIVESSPVQLLMRPGGKERPRERTLSDDELRAFLTDPIEATRFPRLAHVITILLATGQRRGELVGARWREVDLKGKTWTIPAENSKTGRGHVVPLNDMAVIEFRKLKDAAGRSPWVLPADDPAQHADAKLYTRGVARCLKRFKELGIKPFTLHDLRRTCRTGLARLKIEPHIAERVLNHAQERIPGTYDQHDYLDEKRAALDKWGAHLGALRE